MGKTILILISLVVSSFVHANADGDINTVKEFVRVVVGKETPTIEDYHRFYGQGAEDEIAIGFCICELNKWQPSLDDKRCSDFILGREKNQSRVPSLFFAWLRTKVPLSSDLKVIAVRHFRKKDFLHYDEIQVQWSNHTASFQRPIGPRAVEIQFGEIGLNEFDGRNIDKLLEHDLKENKKLFRQLVDRLPPL